MHIDIKNLKNNLLNSLNRIKFFFGGDLFLFYDYLPIATGGGFQSAECNYLLKEFNKSANFSLSFPIKKDFKKALKGYFKLYTDVPKRFYRINKKEKVNFKLAYGIFLNTVYNYLDIFERNKIPFMFVLYPGGGFGLDNEESDNKLKRVINSEMFKKVIVTMPITRDYLLKKNFCSNDKIEYIYGVIPQNIEILSKKLYKKDKNTFDICFVAHKYSLIGEDKGYDTFIETAKKLIPLNKDIHIHIVGPWENVIDTKDIKSEQLHFYGTQPVDFFTKFYSQMDILLTPNRYQRIYKGNFDGFPLGSEAAISGVYVMTTDPLNMKPNTPLKNCKGFEVITNDVDEIVKSICEKMNNLDLFYKDSKEQKVLAENIFDFKEQIKRRIEIIKDNI